MSQSAAAIEIVRKRLADAESRAVLIQQEIVLLQGLLGELGQVKGDSAAAVPSEKASVPRASRVVVRAKRKKPQPPVRGKVTGRIFELVKAKPGMTLKQIGETLAPEFPDMKDAVRNIYNTAHAMSRRGRIYKPADDRRIYLDENTWRRMREG
ncbi:MAG: hypothetical protein KF684_00270 [Phycisphaeraceae bacterium]|nr:hypothetical protein [Phycisphaeraceae bacterium]